MSVKVMSWVWDNSTSEGTDRLVLLAIADSCDHDGTNAWPAIPTIAAKCRVSPRTVKRSIVSLEEAGEIVVERNMGGMVDHRPDRRPNRYRVTMSNPTERGDTDVTACAPRGDTGGKNGVTSGVTRGDTGVTQPVLDPSKDPSERVRARDSLPPPHQLPPDWQPTAEHRALCLTHRWDRDHEADRFRNHSRATGRKLQDWDAAFESWLTNQYPNKPAAAGSMSADARAQHAARRERAVAALDAGKINCWCGGVLECSDRDLAEGQCRSCGATAIASGELVPS